MPTCFQGSRGAQGVQASASLPENGGDYGVDGVESSKAGVGRQVRLLESPGEGRIGRESLSVRIVLHLNDLRGAEP